MKPSWRKPIGVLGMVAGIAIYAAAVASAAPWFSQWPALAQLPIYLILGIIWILPLKPLLLWMETGHWKLPR